jgi:poly(hydroxyalkanoate) depolymerase family esterase
VVLPTIPPSRYRVFVPSIAHAKASRWGRNRRPLLVLLHGCLQTASTMESGTRMNETAEREGFFVLYPDQARGRNMMNCWNWFDPRNQRPYSGELAEILAMIKQIEAEYAIDHERIYVAGLSSGAATAASLLACHPDRFAGGLLHSGPAYASAQGLFEGAHAMRLGPMVMAEDSLPANPKAFSGRLLLVQGDRDHIVHPSHQQRLVEQFATRDELSSAHSWSWRAPASDPSVSAPETYSAHLTAYGSGRAETPRICRVTIEGLGHAWSGGKNTSFNDPRGPSINEAFVRYFLKGELPLPEAAPALKELS